MDAIATALVATFQPFTLLMLMCGVLMGLTLGVIPGVGGLLGMVLLVPLTFHMDAYAAIALLLGLAAVTTTSDTIPAVLIGVPGSAGAITTLEDGHPLAKQGEAPRALGAAYLSSMIGGLIGAIVLALSIPVMRPLITSMKTPDFLAVSVAGLLFVSVVSGKDGLKGIAAMLTGILVAMVGLDPQTGSERYTGGLIYFWEGVPLAAALLGLFGVPELAALLRRRSVAESVTAIRPGSIWTGFRDVLREWWLVLRCSTVGAVVGAIPGIGVIVIDWIAYGIAARNRRGGPPYGQGNIRGVIAPESANNAKEGGYLIPTIAFGIPGSAGMTLLLAALTIQGLSPGPAMLGKDLPVTLSMVFFLAIANVIGAAICIAFTNQLARIAFVPSRYVVSIAIAMIVLGAMQMSPQFETAAVLIGFSALGMVMKARAWSRAALALGFVLGPNVERYFFLSYQLSGFEWLLRPSVVLVMLGATVSAILAVRRWRRSGRPAVSHSDGFELLTYAVVCAGALLAVSTVATHPLQARMVPQIAATALLLVAVSLGLRYLVLRWQAGGATVGAAQAGRQPEVLTLTAAAAVVVGLYAIGHLATVVAFIAGFAMLAGERRPWVAVVTALGTAGFVWAAFDVLLGTAWPRSTIWTLVLQAIPI